MADTQYKKVTDFLVAAWNANAGKPCQAFKTRSDAFAAGELPATVIRAKHAASSRQSQNVSQKDFTIVFEHHVADVAPADDALDPQIVFTPVVLFNDETLGGLVSMINEGDLQWLTDVGAAENAMAHQEYTVRMNTKSWDLTQKGI